jgi:hypothetical protein
MVYNVLPSDLQDLPLWLGEVGDLRSLQCGGVAPFIENLRLFRQATRNDTYLKVAALWTVGYSASEEWRQDNLSGSLWAISDFLIKE